MAKPTSNKITTKRISLLGILFALAITLSFLEQLLPALPGLPPGSKLGLSNVVVMYCIFSLGKGSALTVVVLKAAFALFRGATAGLLSLTGGLISFMIIILFMQLFRGKISYLILSILGAIFHNIGQLTLAVLLVNSTFLFVYLPFLILSGIVFGSVTSLLLKVTLPALEKIQSK